MKFNLIDSMSMSSGQRKNSSKKRHFLPDRGEIKLDYTTIRLDFLKSKIYEPQQTAWNLTETESTLVLRFSVSTWDKLTKTKTNRYN